MGVPESAFSPVSPNESSPASHPASQAPSHPASRSPSGGPARWTRSYLFAVGAALVLIGICSTVPTEEVRFGATFGTAALVDSGRKSRVDPGSGSASTHSNRLDRKGDLNQERIVRSMGLLEAVSRVDTSGTATVAVIDAGISTRGPVGQPLAPGFDVVDVDTSAWRARGIRLIPGEDYTEPDGDVTSRSDHGSVVAGAVRSACPGCTIMPVRAVFPVEVARGDTSVRVDRAEQDDVARAIRHATDRGADVINLSLGFAEPGERLALAINYAYGRGVVLVAAAGNGGRKGLLYPARYAHAIGVGASTLAGRRASFSNVGRRLSVAAPGRFLPSTSDSTAERSYTGTSISAAYVSGVAGLLRMANPTLGAGPIRGLIRTCGARARFDVAYGRSMARIVDARRAVWAALEREGSRALDLDTETCGDSTDTSERPLYAESSAR